MINRSSQNFAAWGCCDTVDCHQAQRVGGIIAIALSAVVLISSVFLILAQNGVNLGGLNSLANLIDAKWIYTGMGLSALVLGISAYYVRFKDKEILVTKEWKDFKTSCHQLRPGAIHTFDQLEKGQSFPLAYNNLFFGENIVAFETHAMREQYIDEMRIAESFADQKRLNALISEDNEYAIFKKENGAWFLFYLKDKKLTYQVSSDVKEIERWKNSLRLTVDVLAELAKDSLLEKYAVALGAPKAQDYKTHLFLNEYFIPEKRITGHPDYPKIFTLIVRNQGGHCHAFYCKTKYAFNETLLTYEKKMKYQDSQKRESELLKLVEILGPGWNSPVTFVFQRGGVVNWIEYVEGNELKLNRAEFNTYQSPKTAIYNVGIVNRKLSVQELEKLRDTFIPKDWFFSYNELQEGQYNYYMIAGIFPLLLVCNGYLMDGSPLCDTVIYPNITSLEEGEKILINKGYLHSDLLYSEEQALGNLPMGKNTCVIREEKF
jgi:hypothetical protein